MENIVSLVRELKEKGIGLGLSGDDLEIFLYDDDSVDDQIVEVIKKYKSEIKDYLKSFSSNENYRKIEIAPSTVSYPLSHTQKRLWLSSQIKESSIAYNMPCTIELREDYDIESFKKAIESVIDRHEILRTVFKEDESGEVRQFILPKESFNFEITYLDLREEKNKETQLEEHINRDVQEVFDLEYGPLLRVSLLHMLDKKYVFYYNMHHIISDGWSIELLAREILVYYEAFKTCTKPNLPKLEIQYKDYCVWQQEQLSENELNVHKSYWSNKFQEETPTLDLLIAKERPPIKTYNGSRIFGHIDSGVSKKLRNIVQSTNTTLYMNLLSIVSILLYRYSYQKSIVIGSPVAGRIHPDLKNQIGCYINTLAIQTDVQNKESYTDLLNNVKQQVLEAQEHESYPFDSLVEELALGKDLSRSPLFDVSLVVNDRINEEDQYSNTETSSSKDINSNVKSKFDITFYFSIGKEKINYNITYNTDLYEKKDIEKLSEQFTLLLETVVNNSDYTIDEFCYNLTGENERDEQDRFLEELKKPEEDQTYRPIIKCFEHFAENFGSAISIELGDVSLSYAG
ncbi:condensation domain-containing protein, partial [uncultured Aquimarina sp.]|uniref:condensation domain-containing protein n=1 Tax=uncultured Aquimarina sp. TaxID=575652 RepID=UPI0026050D94